MPLLLDTVAPGSAVAFRRGDGISIGLVNNMPDGAIEATERQFVELLRAAAGDTVVRLALFALPEVPRGAAAREQMAGRYRDIAELWDARLDGLIVTGTEPRAQDLKDEPYWGALTQVVDWAGGNTAAAIWSCLAAHAAVLHAEGIERRALAQKAFGVFDCEVAAGDALTMGAAARFRVPHSRHNDLPAPALVSSGYRLLGRSALAGVDMFAREEKRGSSFLFLQGHPEYEGDTLLREYRRDVVRFLRGEREIYPPMPHGYFTPQATLIAQAFRGRALDLRTDSLAAAFPMAALAAGMGGDTQSPWRGAAVGLYRRWLAQLRERAATGRATLAPPRKPWRSDRTARRLRPAAG